jgi:sterol desaturase/sphingolipid hydroxylase (fatty acid hydroxylase superfamily)
MENNASTIEMLFERAEDYTRTTVELAKLNAVDKTADVMSSLLSRLTVSIVFVLFAFLANIGLSLWIGELLGKVYYGFFIVSSIYLIVAIVLYLFKDQWLKMPISNFIIIKMLKKS